MSVKKAALIYAIFTGDLATAHLVSSIHDIVCACKEVRAEERMQERVTQEIRDEAAIKDQLDKMMNSASKNGKRNEA